MKLKSLVLSLPFIFSFGASAKGMLPVAENDFGKGWAFTFKNGALLCKSNFGNAVFIVNYDNGKMYPLNGTASAATAKGKVGAFNLDDVWKEDIDVPGTKVSISPFIDAGLNNCN